MKSLIDRAISVDEDSLGTPLEPIKAHLEESSDSDTSTNKEDMINNDLFEMNSIDNDEKTAQVSSEITNGTKTNSDENEDKINETRKFKIRLCQNLSSILRRGSVYDSDKKSLTDCDMIPMTPRRVSFPTNEEILVTYREPDFQHHWSIGITILHQKLLMQFNIILFLEKLLKPNEILKEYQESCKKHNTVELNSIKDQLLVNFMS